MYMYMGVYYLFIHLCNTYFFYRDNTFWTDMDDYFICTKESLKLDAPFRLIIIGPMHSGYDSQFMNNTTFYTTTL